MSMWMHLTFHSREFLRVFMNLHEAIKTKTSQLCCAHMFSSQDLFLEWLEAIWYFEKKVWGEGRLIESHGSRCSFNLGRRNVAMMRETFNHSQRVYKIDRCAFTMYKRSRFTNFAQHTINSLFVCLINKWSVNTHVYGFLITTPLQDDSRRFFQLLASFVSRFSLLFIIYQMQ